MTKALADIFSDARSPRVEWKGEPAYAIYEIAPAPNELHVEFIKAKTVPVQGLTLKAHGGVLVVNDVEAQEIILWGDTSPSRVSVRIKRESGKTVALKLWNVWRGRMGGIDVTQAWLGNSGMRVEKSSDANRFLLRCSDGEGPIEFSNLEIGVSLV